MSRRRRTGPLARAALRLGLVLALVHGGLVPAGAAAQETGLPSYSEYRVEVTGLHLVEWQYRSEGYPSAATGWTRGNGSQTLGWHTRTPVSMRLITLPPGSRLRGPSIGTHTLFPTSPVRIRATVTRRTLAVRKLGRPICEGGDVVSCGAEPAVERLPQACGRRRAEVGFDLRIRAGFVQLRSPAPSPQQLYQDCLPDTGRLARFVTQLETPAPLLAVFPERQSQRFLRLRPGAATKLHYEASRRDCPLAAQQANGYEECAITDVTLEVERVR